MQKGKNSIIEIIIVIFLVLTSGYLGIGSLNPITIPLFVVSVVLFLFKRCKIGMSSIIVLAIFFLLLFAQRSMWGGSSGNVLNIGLQVISFALLAACVESSFARLFPTVIFWIAGVSLVFYFIDHLGGHSILLSIAQNFPINLENQNDTMDGYSFLLYVVDAGGGLRNSGPFFEPGRYVVVLLIAIAINFENDKIITDKENIVLILSVLTTISLTGISTLFVVWLLSFIKKEKKKFLYFIPLLIIVVIILFPLFSQSEYFGGKLADNYEKIDDSNSRFGALLYLWSQVIESPVVGYGPAIYIFDEFEVFEISSPNGWGELMRYWGIPMAIACFVLIYRSSITMNQHENKGSWAVFVAAIMVAFPQSVMMTPLYYVLYFLGARSFRTKLR